jgi:hypothetical protein
MRAGNQSKSVEVPDVLDFPWLEEQDAEFEANQPPPAAQKIVQFNQPLDSIAVGMQLVQVLPILQQLSQQQTEIFALMKAMRVQISRLQKSDANGPGWLDAEEARKYLSMSKNTFEKYVYTGKIKVKRYRVGGKNYFCVKDLDLFMTTWEDKTLGFA